MHDSEPPRGGHGANALPPIEGEACWSLAELQDLLEESIVAGQT